MRFQSTKFPARFKLGEVEEGKELITHSFSNQYTVRIEGGEEGPEGFYFGEPPETMNVHGDDPH